MTRITSILIMALFITTLAVSPATAGNRSRHRWQGVAIGAASMFLLNHLIGAPPAYGRPACRTTVRYVEVPPPPGHYEKRWVPRERWERFWVPGHYTRRGRYIEGHYEQESIDDGGWESIWVPGY
ncbi:MAG: hypothetical protein GXP58_01625 [Deltaproteobacteria bacterium]|nr:hypothetical protein [Deltaproteobacteria bacterium]